MLREFEHIQQVTDKRALVIHTTTYSVKGLLILNVLMMHTNFPLHQMLALKYPKLAIV